MTDNKIIKSLECLMHDNCEDCPYYRDDCVDRIKDPIELSKCALDLINRQQSEIERLQYQVNRLKNYDERRDIDLHSRLIANARAEAIKEFAKRLKNSIYINTNLLTYQCEEVESMIDDIVKEMVGDNK